MNFVVKSILKYYTNILLFSLQIYDQHHKVQAMLLQLVGSQSGHRRGPIFSLGHKSLLQCAECGESV